MEQEAFWRLTLRGGQYFSYDFLPPPLLCPRYIYVLCPAILNFPHSLLPVGDLTLIKWFLFGCRATIVSLKLSYPLDSCQKEWTDVGDSYRSLRGPHWRRGDTRHRPGPLDSTTSTTVGTTKRWRQTVGPPTLDEFPLVQLEIHWWVRFRLPSRTVRTVSVAFHGFRLQYRKGFLSVTPDNKKEIAKEIKTKGKTKIKVLYPLPYVFNRSLDQ